MPFSLFMVYGFGCRHMSNTSKGETHHHYWLYEMLSHLICRLAETHVLLLELGSTLEVASNLP
jgi:hypothetical protein